MIKIVSCVLLCFCIMYIVAFCNNRGNDSAYANATTSVITSVDTSQLFSLLGLHGKSPVETTVTTLGVRYNFGTPKDAIVQSVEIGIWKTTEQAKEIFSRSSRIFPVGPTISSTIKSLDGRMLVIPGDEFAFWQDKAYGDGLSGTLLIRRDNSVLDLIVHGQIEEVLSLARKIDDAIIRNDKITHRGTEVMIPETTISVPDMVPIGSSARIVIQSKNGSLLRIGGGNANELVETGTVICSQSGSVEPESVGLHVFNITMATEGNVIFTQSVSVQFVTKEQYRARHPVPTAWELPENSLYFIENSNDKWDNIPTGDREWIRLYLGTFALIGPGDEKRRNTQLAFDDIQQVIKVRWLPDFSLCTLALDHSTAIPKHVIFSSYSFQGLNFALLGTIGENYLLYIEQPLPLLKNVKPVSVDDIVINHTNTPNDHGMTLPVNEVLSRVMTRYRALKPNGPYTKVQILLIKIKMSGSLTLQMPGYK